MLHTLFLFWRSIYEVYSENSQALLLGARRALFRVSSVAVLLACMIQPSFADFTTSDSNNLSSINTKLSTVSSYLSSAVSRLGDILNAFTSSPMAINIGSIVNNTQAISGRLDTIISLIQSASGVYTYYIIEDQPYMLAAPEYTQMTMHDGSNWYDVYTQDNGLFPSGNWSNILYINFYSRPHTDSKSPVLYSNKRYVVSFSFPGTVSGTIDTITFSVQGRQVTVPGEDATLYSQSDSNGSQGTLAFSFSVPQTQTVGDVQFWLSGTGRLNIVSGGYVRCVIQAEPEGSVLDDALSGGVNPDQSAVNDSIGSAVSDLDDFDNQIFADFDNYKSDLDFGLSAWSEAAAGISYIGNIFMVIWDNSPNQVIVLSLMLGLCGLVLGRGARLARAVRRSDRGADDG